MAKNNLSQNYSYANNSKGELINVSFALRGEQYFCPICGEQMTPHMGKVRRWHFSHRNVENCSYESYLHNLAKIRIRQVFLSSGHFYLSYAAKAVCSLSCPFVNFPKCDREKQVDFDLHSFYDTCEIEATYKQFRADLLLSSSIKPSLPPVLIEISVTHKCTLDKINDGVRIIEIPIETEKDIDDIVLTRKFDAVRNSHYNHSLPDIAKITLYNFNKVESFNPAECIDLDFEDCFYRKDTIVFILNQQGQFRTFNCRCFEVASKIPPNVHYFITQIATQFKEIFQEFSKRGVKIRNCFLCKFSKKNDFTDERICILYKKHNLPRKPSPSNALTCPHYKEDFEPPCHLSLATQDPNYPEYKHYYHICKEIL